MTCGFNKKGAIFHTARVTMDLLRREFGEDFISRLGPVNWPPRSCDLTSLDYFLWDYVTAHACTGKPASIDELEDIISGKNVGKSMPELDYADEPFDSQSRTIFAWNNLQALNYMDCTIDSNKDFMNCF